jgi:hypothetical protein
MVDRIVLCSDMHRTMSTPDYHPELEEIEIQLLLEGVARHYGYDFRNYALASLKRRIWNTMRAERVKTVSALQDKVLHDPACMERFLLALTVNAIRAFTWPFAPKSCRCCGLIHSFGSGTPAAPPAKKCIRWRSCCTRPDSTIAAEFMRPI